ncbi:hypothetical protein V2G26_016262 [Clonostachys chloroleuca]
MPLHTPIDDPDWRWPGQQRIHIRLPLRRPPAPGQDPGRPAPRPAVRGGAPPGRAHQPLGLRVRDVHPRQPLRHRQHRRDPGQGRLLPAHRLRQAPSVRPLWDFPELPLLLVDTKQAKSTAFEVAKVGTLNKTHPDLVGSILDAMGKVTTTVADLIEEEDFDATDEEDLRRVGELMTINHGLLVSLGVSHPRLERIRELVDHEGIGWTKLTGAGGGGCSITLLRPELPIERLNKLEAQLEEENYQKFETTLGGDGVGVLWPAVLKNGTEEDEQGGMEIDLEKFLNAEGTEGVERLVGVHGHGGEREGWKFWRVESRI